VVLIPNKQNWRLRLSGLYSYSIIKNPPTQEMKWRLMPTSSPTSFRDRRWSRQQVNRCIQFQFPMMATSCSLSDTSEPHTYPFATTFSCSLADDHIMAATATGFFSNCHLSAWHRLTTMDQSATFACECSITAFAIRCRLLLTRYTLLMHRSTDIRLI
jgi:hypothetical protein